MAREAPRLPNRAAPAPAPLDAARAAEQKATESLIELGVIVYDYQGKPQSKEHVDRKVREYVDDLRNLEKCAEQLKGIVVPIDILNYIDNGRNPDVYSREFIEVIVKQNQYLNGKMSTMARFRNILAEKVTEAFPDIAEDVCAAVQATSP